MENRAKKKYKNPVSVLVVLYSVSGRVLLLERADRPGFWQSVTGSQDDGETLRQTALREVSEETGILLADEVLTDHRRSISYEIYPHWQHRYAPGVTHNTEHLFSAVIGDNTEIRLSPAEHLQWGWYDRQSAAEKVFSPSNREALLDLVRKPGTESGSNREG